MVAQLFIEPGEYLRASQEFDMEQFTQQIESDFQGDRDCIYRSEAQEFTELHFGAGRNDFPDNGTDRVGAVRDWNLLVK